MRKSIFAAMAVTAALLVVSAGTLAPVGAADGVSDTSNRNTIKPKPFTEAEYEEMSAVQKAGSQLYRQLLASDGKEKAIAEAVNYFKSQPIVKDVGVSTNGIWVIYGIGVKYTIVFTEPGYKGVGR